MRINHRTLTWFCLAEPRHHLMVSRINNALDGLRDVLEVVFTNLSSQQPAPVRLSPVALNRNHWDFSWL